MVTTSYLVFYLYIDDIALLKWKFDENAMICIQCDFPIVYSPFRSGNIPTAVAYGVNIS